MKNKYNTITELPNTSVSTLQLKRAHQRYVFASKYCNNKHVVEIGCGGGQGLGLLSINAKNIIGCDVDETNLEIAKNIYYSDPKVTIKKMDAEKLLFDDNSIDTIILFETIYYINMVNIFFLEAHRVLKKNGHIIICTANKNWPDFNPSPYSIQYYGVPELYKLSSSFGFEVEMYGSFPETHDTTLSRIISFIKKKAVKFYLMPKTMKGKVLLKKIFVGKILTYPEKLRSDLFDYTPPVIIPHNNIDNIHTAIFAVCKKL